MNPEIELETFKIEKSTVTRLQYVQGKDEN